MGTSSATPPAHVTGHRSRPLRWSPAVLLAAANPDAYLRHRQRRDGDPFRVRFPGMGETLFTGRPDGAREIFRTSPTLLEPPAPNPIEPLLGSGSLILLNGERHTRERKLMMPPFHGARMHAYGDVIEQAAITEIGRWRAGAVVSALPAAQRITLDVIIRAVFGVEDGGRQQRYRAVIGELLRALTPPLLLFPQARRSFGGRGPWVRFQRLRAELDALLTEEIAARHATGSAGGPGAGGGPGTGDQDVLSLLMSTTYEDGATLSDDDLLDELRTLLVAGHETTATAIAWALFHIHHCPEIHEQLLAELRPLGPDPSPDVLAGLPYLGAVCSESLRAHPVVPIVLRRVTEPTALRGVPVRAGQTIGIAVPLLHSDPQAWPEPSRFLPERFLDRSYSPFEYAPFGGGHRRCLGAALATYELRIIIGAIMGRATLALSPRDRRRPAPPSIPKNITTGPRREIRLTRL